MMRPPRTRSAASAPHVDLRIDAVIIDGYSAADSRAIAAALERELGRLLQAGAAPIAARWRTAGDRAIEHLGATMHSGAKSPDAVGRAAARAVVQGLRALPSGRQASTRGRA